MKLLERDKAIKLRADGMTYSEIQDHLKVSKSSLSRWLLNIPYVPLGATLDRRRRASIQSGHVLRDRKIERVSTITNLAKQEIRKIGLHDLKLLGIMAYWTEGSKTLDSHVQFTNTDPSFIQFVLKWLREICNVREEKIKVHLRVHPDVNRKDAETYWAKLTRIPIAQFHNTTMKISGSGGRKYTKLGTGIATITVCDTNLHYKIKGWIEGLKKASL
jgi:hypothetical protein